jgi:hypothetical protein
VLLSAVFGFEAFASLGLGSAALVAFMSRATDPRYTATQYALFSSLAAVPRTFINSSVGYIVAETGWFWFFIVCFILAFPAMMMLPKIAPWNSGHEKPKLKAVLALALCPAPVAACAGRRHSVTKLSRMRGSGDAAQFDQQSKLQVQPDAGGRTRRMPSPPTPIRS